jgi:hypothetical protein
VKTFLLLSIEFLSLKREVGRSSLRIRNKKIKRILNKDSKIKGLPIEWLHALWRDGGLSYPNLRDRGDVLTIRSFVEMTLSDDAVI